MDAEPLPTTRAAIYGWWWIAQHKPWHEAIACSTVAEWHNDDRLVGDLGGGNCTRLRESWARDLGFRVEQMPNFTAHSKADEKHSEMFLDVLEKYVPPGGKEAVIQTARESTDLHRAYFGGMAMVMQGLS